MTQDELQDVMLDQLRVDGNLNKTGETPTADTVHSDILSESDGFGSSNSASIYKANVEWTLHNNGDAVKPWGEWLGKTVKELAAILVMLLLFFTTGLAQKPLSLSLGAVRTDAGAGAISFGLSYIPNLSFSGTERLKYGKHSIFSVSPNVEITSGSADAFSSIVAKFTGLEVIFQTHKVGNITAPDVTKTLHTFPFSLGVESSSRFNFINALFEAGYVPWYGASASDTWLKHTKVGVFVQAGYKFKVDSLEAADQSQEGLNTGILRLKGSAGVDSRALVSIQNLRLGLAGTGDVWLDLLNAATYYRIVGALRMYLNGDNYLDFQYQRGSGAPNFNKGDQWGIALNISF